jgi:hypothetical protein
LLQAWVWHHRLADDACVVNSITDSSRGRWRRVKGLDYGQERRRGGSEEDSTMAWRLQGGLNDDMGSGRSMMVRAPGKFSVGNFGSLMA